MNICLLVLTHRFWFCCEELSNIQPITFSARISSEFIKIRQPLLVHLEVEFSIGYLVEEASEIKPCTLPRHHSDSRVSNCFEKEKILYLVAESQKQCHMVKVTLSKRPSNPGSNLVIGSKKQNVSRVHLFKKFLFTNRAKVHKLSLFGE